ncbi:MAG: GGDEF domain-containing protein [Gammaproteobacteria bacterium]|nr:GGDEF domain-containing protein [Gammaproteobacteria bacterium]
MCDISHGAPGGQFWKLCASRAFGGAPNYSGYLFELILGFCSANGQRMDFDKTTSFDLSGTLGDNQAGDDSKRLACLVVISGVEPGRVYWLVGDEYVIGRGDNATICLEDDGISRQHAFLRQRQDKAFILTDLDSSNGTFCNNEPVTNKVLQEGDRLHLGTHTVLKFSYRDELEQDFLARQYDAVTRDALTQCFNKKYFLDRFNSEHSFAERHGQCLALALVDVDHFKAVNDTYGHQSGDHVLKGLADVMRNQLCAEDVLARYGGEEFALLIRDKNADEAAGVVERIRHAVEAAVWGTRGRSISVTISSGVTFFGPDTKKSPEMLFDEADEALYRAKHGGRNRTERTD